MLRLLADVNAEGYLATLVRVCQTPMWAEFWEHLNAQTLNFAEVGLHVRSKDPDVWRFCQNEGMLLFTCNRKNESDDSLEATIRQNNTPDSLPVITLANQRLFRRNRTYRERTAVRFLEILLELDRYRGAGRVFIPGDVES